MELIDKETNVWTCALKELSQDDIELYFNTYENAPLDEFVFEIDLELNAVKLIKDSKSFQFYSRVVPKYLRGNKEDRQHIRQIVKEKYNSTSFEDNFDILDRIRKPQPCYVITEKPLQDSNYTFIIFEMRI